LVVGMIIATSARRSSLFHSRIDRRIELQHLTMNLASVDLRLGEKFAALGHKLEKHWFPLVGLII
jgi:hypothetical protein